MKITKKYASNRNKTTELTSSKKILAASILVVYNEIVQAVILKSIIPDPK